MVFSITSKSKKNVLRGLHLQTKKTQDKLITCLKGKILDYVVDLIGVDHVGIGADWDGVEILPKNIEHIGKLSSVTELLLDRGYSTIEIRKILGGNFKRVYKEVLR